MAAVATVTVKGDDKLIKKFDKLKIATQNRIARRASKTAMIPVKNKQKTLLKSNGSQETGALVRSIGQKTVTQKNVTMTFVGPRVGDQYASVWQGRIRKPHKYAHLVEFGYGPGGFRKRTMPAKPFAKPSLLNQQDIVVGILGRELGRLIEEQATKV